MTRKDFEWIADRIGPMMHSPIGLEMIADDLEAHNPRFNRKRFLDRAIKAWEKNNVIPEFDDEIPF